MHTAVTFQLYSSHLQFHVSGRGGSVNNNIWYIRPWRPQPGAVRCMSSNATSYEIPVDAVVARRSADYKDCVWDHDFIQHSMHTKYNDVKLRREVEGMKKEIGEMLGRVSVQSVAKQLELIDDLQRLGLGYHFHNQIKSMLDGIYYKRFKSGESHRETDLHTAALTFRLLRNVGHFVPEGIFKCFLDRYGEFNTSLYRDVKGMISLYEASFLGIEGETIMDQARTFAVGHFKKADDDTFTYLGRLTARALEMPLHWRPKRAEARWYMEEAYGKKPNMSLRLLQFTKLDYNIVQAMYQEELLDLSRWWKSLGFKEGLGFARDCLVASYLWGIHICPDPQYAACRKVFAKTIALVCTVDDVCDIYATLEEVKLLTDTFTRWDIESMNQLPPYMKKCYLACYNTVNQMAYEVLNQAGSDVTAVFKNAWAKLTKVYLKEARWFNNGHKPTLDEYLKDAWISVGSPLVSVHAQAFDPNSKADTGIELKYLESDPDIFKWSAMIVRLTDDLGTSSAEMARGDTPKAIQCYMHDTGASEEGARESIKEMVREGWKKLNKCKMEERTLRSGGVDRLMNLARASHCFYLHGDGHGVQDQETKQLMSQIIFDPIP